MKISKINLFSLELPFVDQFSHASKTRQASDAIIMQIETSRGVIAYGETLVRPYLSGESIDIVFDSVRQVAIDLKTIDWELGPSSETPLIQLQHVTRYLNSVLSKLVIPKGVKSFTGTRCLIELALIDGLLRENSRNLSSLLPSVKKEVIYSGVISSESADKSIKIAKQLRQLGMMHFKLKVTPATSIDTIKEIRSQIGSSNLRLDANNAFQLDQAKLFCQAVEAFDISAIEEPLASPNPEKLRELQNSTSIRIMVDEALITLEDAKALLDPACVRSFNIRLAKCGGIAPCLELINLGKDNGVSMQLGALVGETAILSAVGRSLAASGDYFEFVEGSFGTLLLKEDLSHPSIRFGYGGRAPLLKGNGLGVEVNNQVLEKYTVLKEVF